VLILGFDTATPATVVALLDAAAGTAREDRHDPDADAARPQRPRHMTGLLTLVDAEMRALGAGWEDIDRIAVGVGPGTFTGLRIGVATAQALARTRGIPLVGVSTLHSLALGAARDATAEEDAVLAVIDARRGEVFAAGWSVSDVEDPRAEPLLSPRAVPVDALAETLRQPGHSWVAVGDGSVAFRTALERSGARIPKDDSKRNRVSAIEHCRLARGLSPEPPDGVRPEYLRLPDAEVNLGLTGQR
jgi:tRNA threonylcarbamoyladenosine biosynthesis protein TsaB